MKDLWTKKPKVRDTKSLSGPQCSDSSEKIWKEKKKEQQQRDWEYQKGSTPATGVNTAQTKKPHQKEEEKTLLG